MRVLLVTWTDLLSFVLTRVLNPNLEYCAIVVDNVEKARNITKDIKQTQDIIQPFYELKECIAENYFEVVICAFPFWNEMSKEFKKYGLPKNKLIDLIKIHINDNFLLEKALRHFNENSSKFEMFATGLAVFVLE